MMPSIERLRFVSSGHRGDDGRDSARARLHGRSKIVKFAGCYHGHGDSFLIAAGSGALTHGVPDSPGVTEGTARDTIVLPFNDAAAVERTFRNRMRTRSPPLSSSPIPATWGSCSHIPVICNVSASSARVTARCLIFDEVMSGFRVARGGAQAREGVVPDLTTLGKIIGGGLPVGAFGGRADVMALPLAGRTRLSSGNAVGQSARMAAGLAVLSVDRFGRDALRAARGNDRAARPTDWSEVLRRHGVGALVATAPARCSRSFSPPDAVIDLEGARKSDRGLFAKYFAAMLDRGVYLAPSPFEANFVSAAHTGADVERTIAAADASLAAVLATA